MITWDDVLNECTPMSKCSYDGGPLLHPTQKSLEDILRESLEIFDKYFPSIKASLPICPCYISGLGACICDEESTPEMTPEEPPRKILIAPMPPVPHTRPVNYNAELLKDPEQILEEKLEILSEGGVCYFCGPTKQPLAKIKATNQVICGSCAQQHLV